MVWYGQTKQMKMEDKEMRKHEEKTKMKMEYKGMGKHKDRKNKNEDGRQRNGMEESGRR